MKRLSNIDMHVGLSYIFRKVRSRNIAYNRQIKDSIKYHWVVHFSNLRLLNHPNPPHIKYRHLFLHTTSLLPYDRMILVCYEQTAKCLTMTKSNVRMLQPGPKCRPFLLHCYAWNVFSYGTMSTLGPVIRSIYSRILTRISKNEANPKWQQNICRPTYFCISLY